MFKFNPFQNKPWFLRACCTSLLKTLWEKDNLLTTSNLSFFYSVFQPFGKLSAIFVKSEIVVSKGLKFVVWERVKTKYCSSQRKYSSKSSNIVILINKCSFCYLDLKVFQEGKLLLGRALLLGEIR